MWDRNTGEPIHNALVWQDTRTDKIVDELSADGGQARFQEKVGLPLATYFSGPKVRWILDNVDGARDRAEAGDLAFGNMDTWLIWNLTGGTDGGLHITDVTNASRTMLMDLKTLSWDEEIAGIIGVPTVDAPRDPRLERGLRRGQDRRLHRHPDRRRPRRPAGGHVRPGLPVAGRGQEHLRHRQLPPAQHGHGGGAVQERHAHDRGLQDRRQRRHLLPGGRDRDHRGARAVAARQPQADQGGARGRGARAVGRGQRRPVHRAGLLGPVRAVLEVERPRGVRGPDALRQRRPHRPRDPGGHGLPEPRGRRGDEPGLGRRPRVAEGRRRHGPERPAHAVPGRPPRRAGDPAGRGRDHRPGRGVRRGPRHRVLGAARTTSATTGPRTSAGSRRWTPPSATSTTSTGRRPSRGPSTGSTRIPERQCDGEGRRPLPARARRA